ncbi:hypothetical protein DFS33DRAFT_1274971 [Desarmillaria ectypa]|nr:hypothetical protein DFS33DRAFT_1274971 [Desarmillaria ectypa]
MGIRFSSFPQEIEYCSELSTWWRAILEKRQARSELGMIHQIGEENQDMALFPLLDGCFPSLTTEVIARTNSMLALVSCQNCAEDQDVGPRAPNGEDDGTGKNIQNEEPKNDCQQKRGLETKICERKVFGPLDEGDASFDTHLQEFLESVSPLHINVVLG